MQKCATFGGEKMINSQRQNEIMEILLDEGYMTVHELAKRLHTSESSIRRDLSRLEERGLVQRSYGGAEPITADSPNVSFKMRMHADQQKKKRIAAIALGLIQKGNVVFLDCGSTVQYLVELLPSVKGITVATNGVEALHFLSQHHVRTISTGGTVNPDNSAALIGERVSEFWRGARADVCFFSAQALDGEGNIFDNQEAELASIRAMLPSSALKVFLCDSSKIGKCATFMLGTLRDVNIVICDKDISTKYKKKFPGVTFLHP